MSAQDNPLLAQMRASRNAALQRSQPQQPQVEATEGRPGALDFVRDAGLGAGAGAVGIGQALSGLASFVPGAERPASWAYEGLGNVREGILGLQTDRAQQAREDVHTTWDSDEGFLDNVGNTLGAIRDNPYYLTSAVGETLGSFGGYGKVMKGLQGLSRFARMSNPAQQATLAGALGTGGAVGQIVSEQEDDAAYVDRLAGLGSGAVYAATGALGARLGGMYDPNTIAARLMGATATSTVPTRGQLALANSHAAIRYPSQAALAGLNEGAQEFLQSGSDVLFVNIGLHKDDIWEGVDKAAVIGSISGAMGGGVMGTLAGRVNEQAIKAFDLNEQAAKDKKTQAEQQRLQGQQAEKVAKLKTSPVGEIVQEFVSTLPGVDAGKVTETVLGRGIPDKINTLDDAVALLDAVAPSTGNKSDAANVTKARQLFVEHLLYSAAKGTNEQRAYIAGFFNAFSGGDQFGQVLNDALKGFTNTNQTTDLDKLTAVAGLMDSLATSAMGLMEKSDQDRTSAINALRALGANEADTKAKLADADKRKGTEESVANALTNVAHNIRQRADQKKAALSEVRKAELIGVRGNLFGAIARHLGLGDKLDDTIDMLRTGMEAPRDSLHLLEQLQDIGPKSALSELLNLVDGADPVGDLVVTTLADALGVTSQQLGLSRIITSRLFNVDGVSKVQAEIKAELSQARKQKSVLEKAKADTEAVDALITNLQAKSAFATKIHRSLVGKNRELSKAYAKALADQLKAIEKQYKSRFAVFYGGRVLERSRVRTEEAARNEVQALQEALSEQTADLETARLLVDRLDAAINDIAQTVISDQASTQDEYAKLESLLDQKEQALQEIRESALLVAGLAQLAATAQKDMEQITKQGTNYSQVDSATSKQLVEQRQRRKKAADDLKKLVSRLNKHAARLKAITEQSVTDRQVFDTNKQEHDASVERDQKLVNSVLAFSGDALLFLATGLVNVGGAGVSVGKSAGSAIGTGAAKARPAIESGAAKAASAAEAGAASARSAIDSGAAKAMAMVDRLIKAIKALYDAVRDYLNTKKSEREQRAQEAADALLIAQEALQDAQEADNQQAEPPSAEPPSAEPPSAEPPSAEPPPAGPTPPPAGPTPSSPAAPDPTVRAPRYTTPPFSSAGRTPAAPDPTARTPRYTTPPPPAGPTPSAEPPPAGPTPPPPAAPTPPPAAPTPSTADQQKIDAARNRAMTYHADWIHGLTIKEIKPILEALNLNSDGVTWVGELRELLKTYRRSQESIPATQEEINTAETELRRLKARGIGGLTRPKLEPLVSALRDVLVVKPDGVSFTLENFRNALKNHLAKLEQSEQAPPTPPPTPPPPAAASTPPSAAHTDVMSLGEEKKIRYLKLNKAAELATQLGLTVKSTRKNSKTPLVSDYRKALSEYYERNKAGPPGKKPEGQPEAQQESPAQESFDDLAPSEADLQTADQGPQDVDSRDVENIRASETVGRTGGYYDSSNMGDVGLSDDWVDDSYRLDTPPSQPVDVNDAVTTADAVLARMPNAPEVNLVANKDNPDVPDAVRALLNREGAKAVYVNGQVYINVAMHSDAADVARSIYHETVGHYGLRAILGDGLDQTLDALYDARSEDVGLFAGQYGLNVSNVNERRQATEEMLAASAEMLASEGLLTGLINTLKAWWADLTGQQYTDAQIIRDLIKPAQGFVAAQKANDSKQDEVTRYKLGQQPSPTNHPDLNDINVAATATGKDSLWGAAKDVGHKLGNYLRFTRATIQQLERKLPSARKFHQIWNEQQRLGAVWERNHQIVNQAYANLNANEVERVSQVLLHHSSTGVNPAVPTKSKRLRFSATPTSAGLVEMAVTDNDVVVDSSRFDTLNDNEKAAVLLTLEKMAELQLAETKMHVEHVERAVNRLLASGKLNDVQAQDLMANAVGAHVKRHNKQIVMPYVPQMRRGNQYVVAMSQEYLAAQDALDEAGDTKTPNPYKKDRKHYQYIGAESTTEAANLERELRKQGYTTVSGQKSEAESEYGLSLSDLTQLYARLEQEASSTEEQKIMLSTQVEQEMLNLLNKLIREGDSTITSRMQRENIPGVRISEVAPNVLERLRNFGYSYSASKTAPERFDAIRGMRQELTHVTGADSVNLTNSFDRLMARINANNDGTKGVGNTLVRGALGVNAFTYLLSNPSYYVLQLAQTWMMTAPTLAGAFGTKAISSLGKHYQTMFKPISHAVTKAQIEITFDSMSYDAQMDAQLAGRDPQSISPKLLQEYEAKARLSARHRDVLRELQARSNLDVGMSQEVGIDQHGIARNAASKAMRWMYNTARTMELINRSVSALAAYDLRLEQMLNGRDLESLPAQEQAAMIERATDYASNIVYRTHGDYAFKDAPDAFRNPAMRVILQFKKIALIQANLLYNTAKEGWVKPKFDPRAISLMTQLNLSPAIVKKLADRKWVTSEEHAQIYGELLQAKNTAHLSLNVSDMEYLDQLIGAELHPDTFVTEDSAQASRAGFKYILTTSGLVTGTTAIPLATLILAKVLKAVDDEVDDEGRKFETNEAAVLRAFGPEVGNFILRGAASSLVGVDVSSRIGINFVEHLFGGVYENIRVSSGDAGVKEAIFAFAGPTASLAGDIAKGAKHLQDYGTTGSNRDFLKAIQSAAPLGIRNLITSSMWDREGLVNNSGIELLSPEDFTSRQIIGKRFGFQPSQMSEFYAMRDHSRQIEESISHKRVLLKRAFYNAHTTQNEPMRQYVLEQWDQLQKDQRALGMMPNPRSDLLQYVRQKRREQSRVLSGVQTTNRNRQALLRTAILHGMDVPYYSSETATRLHRAGFFE